MFRSRLIGLFIVLATSIPVVNAATKPSNPVTPAKDCLTLLNEHLESGKVVFQSLQALPDILAHINGGALLVRIDLQGSPEAVYRFSQITGSIAGAQIPRDLVTIRSNHLLFVANGSAEALKTLHQRLTESPFAEASSFQFLTVNSDDSKSLFPAFNIYINVDADEARLAVLEQHINKAVTQPRTFAVYNISREQMMFFVPRAALGSRLSPEFLKEQKIESSWYRRVPTSWVTWLDGRTEYLSGRSVIQSGGSWVILSSAAYARITELDSAKSALFPQTANIENALKLALDQCFASGCEEVSVQKLPLEQNGAETAGANDVHDDSITESARRIILAYIKTNRGSIRLTDPNGLQRALVEIGRGVGTREEFGQFREELKQIGFATHEYQMVVKEGASPRHVGRLSAGWRALLKLYKNSYAQKPITYSNIVRAIREMERAG